MEEARADITTPHSAPPKNVFKRLYAGAKTQSSRTGKPSSKSKGRQISSKFSGTAPVKNNETQAQKPVKRGNPSTTTFTTTTFHLPKPRSSRVSLSGSTFNKRLERVPLSVKNAKNKLRTAKYWFALVDVAEKAENHFVAMELFSLAMHCSAEPVSEVRRARAAYKARYKLADSAQKASDLPREAGEVSQVVEQQNSETLNETNGEKAEAAEAKLFDEAEAVKDLYKEEYSQLASGAEKNSSSPEDVQEPELAAAEEKLVPEVILAAGNDEGEAIGAVESKPVEFRRTPRRACAIKAAQRIEESARKQTRKKASASTPVASKDQESLEVEKMDVNALMKEVVSGITGSSCPEFSDSPGGESLKLDAKDEEFLVINEGSKLNDNFVHQEQQMSGENNASNKENVQNVEASLEKKENNKASLEKDNNKASLEKENNKASLEKKENSKAMPAENRRSARLKTTPSKLSKAPFY